MLKINNLFKYQLKLILKITSVLIVDVISKNLFIFKVFLEKKFELNLYY